MAEVIHFYSVSDEYGCFSNFAPYPIRLGGKLWPTSEHYFQARKFEDEHHREAIRRAKFSQYDDLRSILLGTEDATIVEHTKNDDYWGDGGDGSGKNMLGQILMRVRSELR